MIRIIAILILLSSCSPQKRLNRLLTKYPQLLHSKVDTVYIESVEADTIFYYNQKDTVVIREGKLTMKYFYNSSDSTVYLQGKCAADTLIREIMIPSKVEYKENWYNKILMPFGIIGLVLILYIIFTFVRQFIK